MTKRTRRSAQVVSGFLTPLKAVTSSSYKHLLSTASLKKGALRVGFLSVLDSTNVLKDLDISKSEDCRLTGFKTDPHAEQKSNCSRSRCSLSAGPSLTDIVSICPLAVNPVVYLDRADLDELRLSRFNTYQREQSLLCLILLALAHTGPPTISLSLSLSYDYFIILNSLCCISMA